MSAIGYSGQALQIIVGGELIAAVRTKRVAHANTAIDITDGELDGFRRILEAADTRTVDVQVDGVATVENWPMLRELWLGEELPEVQVQYPDGSAFTGPAFLSSLEQVGESGGVVVFTATLLLSGTIEHGQFLTSEVYPTPVEPPPDPVINYPVLTVDDQVSPGAPVELSWTQFSTDPPDYFGPVVGYGVNVTINAGSTFNIATLGPSAVSFSDEDTANLYSNGDVLEYRVSAFTEDYSFDSNLESTTYQE